MHRLKSLQLFPGFQYRCLDTSHGWAKKKINDKQITPLQTGLGKRMELYWPRRAHRTRVPMYENSRHHLIFDHRFNRWLVMWYRHGLQVFKHFNCRGRSENFEKSKMHSLALFNQLKMSGKLGRAGADKCMSGVRGVGFEKTEKAWTCWWTECGIRRYKIFSVKEFGFDEAFKMAVKMRSDKVRENRQFIMQRNRWRSGRQPIGTSRT